MIYSFDDLTLNFGDYTDIKGKIRREVQAGRLIPVARGLYETDADVSGMYLAGSIYGPSYLSFDYALARYGLIPEAVYHTYTSATFKKEQDQKIPKSFRCFHLSGYSCGGLSVGNRALSGKRIFVSDCDA